MSYAGIARDSRERQDALRIASTSFGSSTCSHDTAIARKAFLLEEHPGYSNESAIVVCSEAGSVIASAFLINCTLPLGSKKLQGVFISSISVAESSRGNGVSRLLIDAAINAAKSRCADLAIVIARRAVDHFYSRFGFWGVSQYSRVTFRVPEGLIASANQIAVRPAAEPDLAACAMLYADIYKGLLGHCERAPELWLYILRKSSYLGLLFDVMTFIDEVVGYAIHDGIGNFHELTTGPETTSCDTFTFLTDCAPKSQFLTLHIPPTHPFLRRLHSVDVSLTIRECPYGGHMVRILNTRMTPGLENEPLDDGMFDFFQTLNALGISSVTDIDSDSRQTVRGSFNIPLMDQI